MSHEHKKADGFEASQPGFSLRPRRFHVAFPWGPLGTRFAFQERRDHASVTKAAIAAHSGWLFYYSEDVMLRLFIACVSLSVLLIANASRADLVQDISTGIDRTTGLQLPNNASDPNWIVGPGAQAANYTGQHLIARSTPLPSQYMSDSISTGSRWDAVNSGQGAEGISMPLGFFSFQTTVDLTGFDPATASVPNLRFGDDDFITNMRINDTIVNLPIGALKGGFDQFYSYLGPVGAGLFKSGVNTISFDMLNVIAGTSMALRMEASVTATPVPEPACASIAAIAGSLMLLSRRRSA